METVAATGDLVHRADQLQYQLEEGSWGIVSVLATELTDAADGKRIGSLNLYWTTRAAFSRDDLACASIYGVHAAIALARSLENAQLSTAMDARKVIGQAQGILMERHRLSASKAFDVLCRYSQDHNIKLREVAQQLITTRALPSAQQPPLSGGHDPALGPKRQQHD